MIAPNDSNHSEPGGDSSDESAMTGAPADIGVIEAAYHDGVVAGVAAYVGNDLKRLIEPRRVRLVTGFVAERAFLWAETLPLGR
jgi:hypothetical protein